MTTAQTSASSGPWARAHGPVVVAVDGSDRNRAAVAWAAEEAERLGVKLVLVTVVDDSALPIHRDHVTEEHARAMLAGVAADVAPGVGEENVEPVVVPGYPPDVLLSRFPDAGVLVVGKRGLGAISRMLVGSTSLAVAGRAHVEVVVVPDTWHRASHEGGAIVVGLDPYRPEDRMLDLAFRRAAALKVPLVAVHGWETSAAAAWGTTAAAGVPLAPMPDWRAEAEEAFDQVLASWRTRWPEVDLRAVHSGNHPATAVLDAAEDAQLVLLGRHAEHRTLGFGFGSVTRAVLHYAECPVAVVPSEHTPPDA
jgi:nucleotide-binding universal stress UspA family protein